MYEIEYLSKNIFSVVFYYLNPSHQIAYENTIIQRGADKLELSFWQVWWKQKVYCLQKKITASTNSWHICSHKEKMQLWSHRFWSRVFHEVHKFLVTKCGGAVSAFFQSVTSLSRKTREPVKFVAFYPTKFSSTSFQHKNITWIIKLQLNTPRLF